MTIRTPNHGATFESFVILAAQHMGMQVYGDGSKSAGLPENADDLAQAREIVEEAFQIILTADGKHTWRFMEQDFSLTFNEDGESPLAVNGENWRYRMPWFFTGEYRGDWLYGPGTQAGRIRVVPHEKITAARSVGSSSTGLPTMAAFRHLEDGKFEALFWPAPSNDDTVIIRIRAYMATGWNLNDRHFAGPEFDQLIKQCVRAVVERNAENQAGVQWASMQETMRALISRDKRFGPRTVGQMLPNSESGLAHVDPRLYHGFQGVTHIDGVALTSD